MRTGLESRPGTDDIPGRDEVIIAVLTFRRNDRIAALVPALLEQAAEVTVGRTRARLLVVDNDPDGGAEAVVHDAAAGWHAERMDTHVRLDYVVERRPGVSTARNRALAEAADADVIVFIDDDEVPATGWLAAMLDTYRRHRADAVAGRVRTVYPSEPDPWITAGGFLERSHRDGVTTGARLTGAATNNLLLDLHTVRRLGLTFDEAFGASGGEDTLFTRMLTRSGARLVWCDEGVVEDVPDGSRLTRRWMLERTFGFGANEPRIDAALAGGAVPGVLARARHAVAGLARVALGVWWLVVSDRHGRHPRAFATRTVVRGAGNVLGAFGYRKRGYASGGSGTRRRRSLVPRGQQVR